MGDPEQPLIPSPPSSPNHHHHHHRRSCDWCRPCRNCCYGCIYKLFLRRVYITIFTTIGGSLTSLLIFWIIIKPSFIDFYITDASLTQFDLNTTTNSTLHYDLCVNVSIQNINKYVGVYYDRLEIHASYEDQDFAAVMLPKFYQQTNNNTDVRIEFQGDDVVVTRDLRWLEGYYLEKALGRFSIEMKMYIRARYNWRGLSTQGLNWLIVCDFKVPLGSSGKASAGSFETTKCGGGYF